MQKSQLEVLFRVPGWFFGHPEKYYEGETNVELSVFPDNRSVIQVVINPESSPLKHIPVTVSCDEGDKTFLLGYPTTITREVLKELKDSSAWMISVAPPG